MNVAMHTQAKNRGSMDTKSPGVLPPSPVMAQYRPCLLYTSSVYKRQGQICMCTSRLIVEEPVYDRFCEAFAAYARTMKVGDPHQKDTIIGPLIKQEQCQIIDSQIQDAVSKGAVLMTGGPHEGNYYQPTVLKDVTPDMRIFYEESFGPVTSIIKAMDAQDAVRLCNDNQYGLSSSQMCIRDRCIPCPVRDASGAYRAFSF